MRTRNYSVLSTVQDDEPAIGEGAVAEAEQELLKALQGAVGNLGEVTIDGRPAKVAADTRATLADTISELTKKEVQLSNAQIEQIAGSAEQFSYTDKHVLLRVTVGELAQDAAVKFDTTIHFEDENVKAELVAYDNPEIADNAKLLMELRRIQYLQNVVMKQLEMTDRSGSSQVVQGMIASGQKFVSGLTAVFDKIGTLSAQIAKGMQNKAEMPTPEQKAAAVQTIMADIKKLPAMTPKQIAAKNMMMQEVKNLQVKFNLPIAAPKASATILQMKAPVSDATKTAPKTTPQAKGVEAKTVDTKVALLAKTDVKPTTPVAKTDVKPVALLAKTDAKATVEIKTPPAKGQPVVQTARTETRTTNAPVTPKSRQTAIITPINNTVSAAVTTARAGAAPTSPVHALQTMIAKALGTNITQTPTRSATIDAKAGVQTDVQVTIVQTAPVQNISVQPVAVMTQTVQPVQAQTTHVQTAQTQPLQQTAQVQTVVQQTVTRAVDTVQPITVQANVTQPLLQQVQQQAQAQPQQHEIVQPVVTQPTAAQPIVTQPTSQQPAATQVSGTQVTGTQAISQPTPIATTTVTPITATVQTGQVVIGQPQQLATQQEGIKNIVQAQAKLDAVEKAPERPMIIQVRSEKTTPADGARTDGAKVTVVSLTGEKNQISLGGLINGKDVKNGQEKGKQFMENAGPCGIPCNGACSSCPMRLGRGLNVGSLQASIANLKVPAPSHSPK